MLRAAARRAVQDILPPLLDGKTASFGYSFILREKDTDVLLLSFDCSLKALRIVTEVGILDAVLDHQIIFERDKKTRRTRISLTTGASAQLVINPPALVPIRSDDVQAAEVRHARAQFYVCAAAGHIR